MNIYLDKNGNSCDVQMDDFQFEIDQDILQALHDEVESNTDKKYIKTLKYKETGEPYIETIENPNYDDELKEELRQRREVECFKIIDQSQLWYEELTNEQLIELKAWRIAWLNVTETMVVPERPAWLA